MAVVLTLLTAFVGGACVVAAALLAPLLNRRLARADSSRRAIADELDILAKMPESMRDGPEGEALNARISAQINALESQPPAAVIQIGVLPTERRAALKGAALFLGTGLINAVSLLLDGNGAAIQGGFAGSTILIGCALLGAADLPRFPVRWRRGRVVRD